MQRIAGRLWIELTDGSSMSSSGSCYPMGDARVTALPGLPTTGGDVRQLYGWYVQHEFSRTEDRIPSHSPSLHSASDGILSPSLLFASR
jgi:hypothetical protein